MEGPTADYAITGDTNIMTPIQRLIGRLTIRLSEAQEELDEGSLNTLRLSELHAAIKELKFVISLARREFDSKL